MLLYMLLVVLHLRAKWEFQFHTTPTLSSWLRPVLRPRFYDRRPCFYTRSSKSNTCESKYFNKSTNTHKSGFMQIRLSKHLAESTNEHTIATVTCFLLNKFLAKAVSAVSFFRSQRQRGRRRTPLSRFPSGRRKPRRLLHPRTPLSWSALSPKVATSCAPPRGS